MSEEEDMEAAVGDDDDVVELADGDICEEDLIENEVVAEDDEEVVEPDLSVRTFTKHENPVFCVNLDPTDQEIVVSGGEDDVAYVWKLEDSEVLFQTKGHNDSVTCAEFSVDSKYVATADMAGGVQVWKVQNGSLVWSTETSDLEWMHWHPKSSVLLVGTEDGQVCMFAVPSGKCKFMTGPCKTTCGATLPDGKRLAVGYENGDIRIWDLATNASLHAIAGGYAHKGEVTTICCHDNGVLVISGSTDTTVKVSNANTGKVLSVFDCSKPAETDAEANEAASGEKEDEQDGVEHVALSPNCSMLAAGTLRGMVFVWDMTSSTLRHTFDNTLGVVRVCWAPNSPVVYAGCLDGAIVAFNALTGQYMMRKTGHKDHLLDMTISKKGYLISASNDRTVKVFTCM